MDKILDYLLDQYDTALFKKSMYEHRDSLRYENAVSDVEILNKLIELYEDWSEHDGK